MAARTTMALAGTTLAALLFCSVALAAGKQGKKYDWQHMTLAARAQAQQQLVVQDWKVITLWQSKQARAIRAGALWHPEPQGILWRIAHMHWTQRELAETRKEIAKRKAGPAVPAGYPPHHALWVCIGRYEGGVTSVNPNGHYGMLQTTLNWMKQLAGPASNYSQVEQEWAAERAWAANGYSYSFLYQQWFAWDNADGCYSP